MDTIITGQRAVAEVFEVSERTVRNWIAAGMPRLSKRRFDRGQIQAWLDRRDGQAVTRSAAPGVDQRQPFLEESRGKDYEDARLKKARAELLEMDLKVRRRELVPIGEVEKMFIDRIMAVKQGLLSLSRALPPQLVVCQTEREMEPVIHKAVHNLLESFARPLPESLTPGGPVSAGPGVAQGG